nr:hypothetical protein [Tanacetum cinerariifolium]
MDIETAQTSTTAKKRSMLLMALEDCKSAGYLSSTNEVNTAYGVSTDNTQVSPASAQVSTASTQVYTANLSDATVYVFLANQPNGVFQKTGRKITINRSDTVGYDKSKVECFNYHKMGHFARECRGPRNYDSRNRNQDSSRRTINVEETSSKAMVAIDGAGSQITYKSRKGVGFVSYNGVPPPHTGLFALPKLDLSNSGLEEFQQPEFEGYGPRTSKSVSEDTFNEVKESLDALLVEELVSDDKLEKGGAKEGKITVNELLKLMCGKKNSVLFTDTGCFVLSPEFKLADESQVLLKNKVLVVKPHNKTPYELFR